ncbi:putative ATP-binding protein involved in virulence [Sedimentibacter acidaminivorans]|uniref:ATP-binding protein involved in virulence n=1 Tax=Sedimentibacter acidaminivorans TaxID=913099 RepID=A0ABS4GI49_9FIRM|nr:hypothetical protein [Sedimentibacter acidaminivorans]MBP1927371.1 putative ATP-binding protein involved in virulence [Sedimentibacter acidaminivorans]
MSKGNGRRNNGQGNGQDKFKGTCNGVSSSKNFEDELESYSNQSKPNSLESKAANFKYNYPSNKSIKEFKNKIK